MEMAYVAPRAALWLALFLLALVDGIRHRAVRSRGCAACGWDGARGGLSHRVVGNRRIS